MVKVKNFTNKTNFKSKKYPAPLFCTRYKMCKGFKAAIIKPVLFQMPFCLQ